MDQEKITKKLIEFRDERNWQDFHTPSTLASSAHLEAGELAQLFQWGKTPFRTNVADEIADNAIYLLYLCEKFKFDLEEIILKKIEKNAIKYPIGDHVYEYGWKID